MKIKSNFKTCLLFYISLILFVSCEEVIDIDLNSSQPVLVAEGTIFKDSVAYLRLTMTSDYFDDTSSSVVEDAIVTLTDDWGFFDELHYVEDGVYFGKNIVGRVGRTYTISFSTMGKNYSATTTLFAPADILNANIEKGRDWKMRGFGSKKTKYTINVSFSDDPLIENFYMLKYWNNKVEVGDRYFITSDVYRTNDIVETSLRTFDLVKGSCLIKVFSIDEKTYKYYRQLNEIDGVRMNSATPYNPTSNFGKEVMGYFTALSYSEVKGEF